MPKLRNITASEVAALVDRAWDLGHELNRLGDMIGKAYCDDIESPIEKATTLMALSRDAAQAALSIMGQAQLQDLRAQRAALQARTAGEDK